MRRLSALTLFAVVSSAALLACDNGATSALLPLYEASTADSGTFMFIDSGVDAAADGAPDADSGGRDAGHDAGASVDAHVADTGVDAAHADSGGDATHDSPSMHDAASDSPLDAMKDASHG